MRKILEDLYFGNIVPYEKRIAADSKLQHLEKRAADCEAWLAEQFNDGEKQTLDTLISTQHEIDSTMVREYFILGFRLGIRLTTEYMDEDDGNWSTGGETMAKRRANGEGNIRKHKDGRWEGRYTAGYDSDTGKRVTKNVLGRTQAEVKEKLKVAIAEGQRLDISKAGNYTVASWVRTWYEVYAEPRIWPNTKEYYTNCIENHIVPGIGKIMLDRLTTIQIQRFYNNLQKNGRVQRKGYPELKDKSLSPRVVRGVHTLLSNCLDQAVAERLILVNPAQGCKLPKLAKKEMRILLQEKIGMYLTEAERRGLLAAFYPELTMGLRRGELLVLLWTDLDSEARTISVTKQVNRIKGELVVSPPKTQNSVRTLVIPQQAVDLLIEEHKKHPCNPYMFPSPKTGTMYDPDAFRRTHDKILKAIGAEHVRFHDMRHLFATLSLKNGVDVKPLSGALGHYSAGFTLNTYTHATAQMKQDAADTIGAVISSQM